MGTAVVVDLDVSNEHLKDLLHREGVVEASCSRLFDTLEDWHPGAYFRVLSVCRDANSLVCKGVRVGGEGDGDGDGSAVRRLVPVSRPPVWLPVCNCANKIPALSPLSSDFHVLALDHEEGGGEEEVLFEAADAETEEAGVDPQEMWWVGGSGGWG
uniref:Uncharacterized protein n=1 Tax=Chromera velia CCMP2878 TaxID=1169474 RepID=A0A0K6S893_9ALVE|eukprot:Cvel_23910.t2-p1 / transcript=Cvel_23910.t2 / gene=Cvel_23910 / organism=Chromera_velia_CCMP2878 / gene_product=hypothetical protein / transcript_product=hypothetical protein / location=Cvel_scaffold2522:5006-5470(+) / protein_length=155 / sequence_SO=supercontig / SO=protein_coding / is_pseudo=false